MVAVIKISKGISSKPVIVIRFMSNSIDVVLCVVGFKTKVYTLITTCDLISFWEIDGTCAEGM